MVTALVGESGAGKSTLAKLISRFWDVGAGSIQIGGIDIRSYSYHALASLMSYVSQDIFCSTPVFWKISEWDGQGPVMKKL